MTDEQLESLVNEIATYGGTTLGLDTSTMYGEFALDVAKAVRDQYESTIVAQAKKFDGYEMDLYYEFQQYRRLHAEKLDLLNDLTWGSV